MSKVQLSSNASGTGTVTLAAPNTNSNVTLNLPATAGTVATAESTLTQFNVTGSAPVYACRAWVNFDGTKDTTGAVSTANTNRLIRASGNVTSVLRNGTGDYTVTFTTAMPDANYCVQGLAGYAGSISAIIRIEGSPVSGSVRLTCSESTNPLVDTPQFNVAIFR